MTVQLEEIPDLVWPSDLLDPKESGESDTKSLNTEHISYRGRGSYGTVLSDVAWKRTSPRSMGDSSKRETSDRRDRRMVTKHSRNKWTCSNQFFVEALTLASLPRHPNLMRIEKLVYNPSKTRLGLTMREASMSLYEWWYSPHGYKPVNWIQSRVSYIRVIIYQLLRGLAFLHRLGYVHRDFKTDNIVVFFKKTALLEYPKVQLVDFGTCAYVGQDSAMRSENYLSKSTNCTTDGFRAPETITSEWSEMFIQKKILHHEQVDKSQVDKSQVDKSQVEKSFAITPEPPKADAPLAANLPTRLSGASWRSDMYSLGAVFFELLSFSTLLDATDATDIILNTAALFDSSKQFSAVLYARFCSFCRLSIPPTKCPLRSVHDTEIPASKPQEKSTSVGEAREGKKETPEVTVKCSHQRLPWITPDALQLLHQLLHPDSTQRISAEQALNHPYFNRIESDRTEIYLLRQVLYNECWQTAINSESSQDARRLRRLRRLGQGGQLGQPGRPPLTSDMPTTRTEEQDAMRFIPLYIIPAQIVTENLCVPARYLCHLTDTVDKRRDLLKTLLARGYFITLLPLLWVAFKFQLWVAWISTQPEKIPEAWTKVKPAAWDFASAGLDLSRYLLEDHGVRDHSSLKDVKRKSVLIHLLCQAASTGYLPSIPYLGLGTNSRSMESVFVLLSLCINQEDAIQKAAIDQLWLDYTARKTPMKTPWTENFVVLLSDLIAELGPSAGNLLKWYSTQPQATETFKDKQIK